jgi:hypothetical protein
MYETRLKDFSGSLSVRNVEKYRDGAFYIMTSKCNFIYFSPYFEFI